MEELHQSLSNAVNASEKIIECLHAGEFDAVIEHDLVRVDCIRALSKCNDNNELAVKYNVQLQKLSSLNQSILDISEQLRDEVLTDITAEQANRLRHEQYQQNQKL